MVMASSDKYTVTVTVDVTGDTTGEKFAGLFKIRTRLSFRDGLEKDKIRRSLLGENSEGATPRATSIAELLAELSVRVVESPSWWTNSENGIELSDDNVLAAVFKAVTDGVLEAMKEVQKKGEAAKEALAQE